MQGASELAHVRPRMQRSEVDAIVQQVGAALAVPDRAVHWSVHQLRAFLSSSGTALPIDAVVMPASEPTESSPAAGVGGGTESDTEIEALLAGAGLPQHGAALVGETLAGLAQLVVDDRPALLGRLKTCGVERLAERQKLANRLSAAARKRGLAPAADSAAARRRDALPVGPVPLGGRSALTICGKTDGFGAQFHAQCSGVAYAERHGLAYVHTPMGPEMDEEFHGWPSEDAADFDVFGGMATCSPRWEELDEAVRARVECRQYASEAHNASSEETGVYYSAEVRALLRRKYEATPKPGPPPACAGLSRGYCALHVRRGDVSASSHANRFTSDGEYAGLVPLLARRHPGLPLVVFSQGRASDFGRIAEASAAAGCELHFYLDGSVRSTFHALVRANALLVARSSFSYAAALLSRGKVYADCIRSWWHAPLPGWGYLAEAEEVGRAARPPLEVGELAAW